MFACFLVKNLPIHIQLGHIISFLFYKFLVVIHGKRSLQCSLLILSFCQAHHVWHSVSELYQRHSKLNLLVDALFFQPFFDFAYCNAFEFVQYHLTIHWINPTFYKSHLVQKIQISGCSIKLLVRSKGVHISHFFEIDFFEDQITHFVKFYHHALFHIVIQNRFYVFCDSLAVRTFHVKYCSV